MPPAPSDLTALIALVLRLARRFQPVLEQPDEWAPDLSLTAWIILTALRDGATHPSRVAEQQRLSAPTVTRHAQRLTERGLLRRTTDLQDLRWSGLHMTREGWALGREADLEVEDRLLRAYGHVPLEVVQAALASLEELELHEWRP